MNVGLFGGSFNPLHTTHLRLARTVREHLSLDEVWFLPVYQPAHKKREALLDFDRRLDFLHLTLARLPGLIACDVERRLEGPSYTIRTVRHLKSRHPGTRFFFIIGGDSLHDLPNWKDAAELVREIPFAVVTRPGFDPAAAPLPNADSRWVPFPAEGTSSSDIRQALRQGRFKHLPVPARVMARIVSGNLYDCWGPTFTKVISRLRERAGDLKKGLRRHIEQVAELTARFAFEADLDPRLGFIAGLAHDLFRAATPRRILQQVAAGAIPLTPREREIPMLAHGAAAAVLLRTWAPSLPEEVFRAIRRHTLPPARAHSLTQALICADLLEPSREKVAYDELREAELSLAERYAAVRAEKARRASGKAGHRP